MGVESLDRQGEYNLIPSAENDMTKNGKKRTEKTMVPTLLRPKQKPIDLHYNVATNYGAMVKR